MILASSLNLKPALRKVNPDDKSPGEIYKITNILNGKAFIGQTRSQFVFASYADRRHAGSYSHSGYVRQFKTHMDGASTDNQNRTRHLNDAIKEFGRNAFISELVYECPMAELDKEEILAIKKHNTAHPGGYNLTDRGSTYEIANLNEIEVKDGINSLVGEIYSITNLLNGKVFIGQTVSHKLFDSNIESVNHGKHLEFGYLARFKEHARSEPFREFQRKSRYVNDDMKKLGERNFVCDKIIECPVDELYMHETRFIVLYNTKHPRGYNLSDKDVVWNFENDNDPNIDPFDGPGIELRSKKYHTPSPPPISIIQRLFNRLCKVFEPSDYYEDDYEHLLRIKNAESRNNEYSEYSGKREHVYPNYDCHSFEKGHREHKEHRNRVTLQGTGISCRGEALRQNILRGGTADEVNKSMNQFVVYDSGTL